MALIAQNERKSKRWIMRNEKNEQVLALHCSFEPREVLLQIEMIDQDYCKENPEEVQVAVGNFIESINKDLDECNLPMITAN